MMRLGPRFILETLESRLLLSGVAPAVIEAPAEDLPVAGGTTLNVEPQPTQPLDEFSILAGLPEPEILSPASEHDRTGRYEAAREDQGAQDQPLPEAGDQLLSPTLPTGEVLPASQTELMTETLKGANPPPLLHTLAVEPVFAIGDFLQISVGLSTPLSNPNPGEAVATGTDVTLTFLKFPDFQSVSADSISLFQDGASIDGFALEHFSATVSGKIKFGGNTLLAFTNLSLTIPDLSLRNGIVTGTVNFSADSATLFPDQTQFTASITNGGGAGPGLSGSLDLNTGAISMTGQSFLLALGNALKVEGTNLTLAYDPGSNDSTASFLTIGTATLSSPEFPTLTTATISNLSLTRDGFTMGSFTAGPVEGETFKFGDYLEIEGARFEASNLGYSISTKKFSGTLGLLATEIALYPGNTSFSSNLTGVTIAFDLTESPTLGIQIEDFEFSYTDALKIAATNVSITPDADTILSIGSATISSPKVASIGEGTIKDLKINKTGFSLGNFTIGSNATITFGSFLSINGAQLSATDLSYLTTTGNLSGTLTLSASGLKLFPNSSTFSTSVTGLAISFDLNDAGHLKVSADTFDLSISDALKISAAKILITPDAATILTIATATITCPKLSSLGTASLSNLVITQTGFSLGSFVVGAGSGIDITVGSFVEITGAQLSITNFSYSTATSAFSGTIAVTATGVSLFPGSTTFTTTVTGFSIQFDFSNSGVGGFKITADSLEMKVGSTFVLTASGVTILPDGNPILKVTSATVTLPSFNNLSGTVNDLEIASDGSVSVVSMSLSTDGLLESFGFGGILPFDITSVAVHFLGDTNNNNQRDAGEVFQIDQFDLSVSGTFNFSQMTSLPFTPIIKIGPQDDESSFSESGTSNFSFTVTIKNGSIKPKDLGPITIGFEDLKIGQTVILGGTITLGGYSDGEWVNDFGGSISVKTSNSMSGVSGGAGISLSGSYDESTGTLSMSCALTISFTLNKSISVTNAGLDFDLVLQKSGNSISLDSLTFNSASVEKLELSFGSIMKLSATNAVLNFNPAADEDLATFESLGASFPGLAGIGGTARNFAIGADGSIKTLPGFGVSLTAGSAALSWPSWLPIQINELALSWNDFQKDPADFKIILSAKVTGLKNLPLQVGGSVTGVVIDIGLLKEGKFAITDISGASISVTGNIFAGSVTGSLTVGVIKVDDSGAQILDSDKTTLVAKRVFYGGIIAGYTFAGLTGWEIRVGVSELGPLSVFVQSTSPVMLDITTGLAVSDFRAGVTFNTTLPSITDPLALRGSVFQPNSQLSADRWAAELPKQVLQQVATGIDGWTDFSTNMKIEGGASLYSLYTSSSTFRADIDLIISTDGKFLISAAIVYGNALPQQAILYADLTKVASGSGSILFLADNPSTTPLLTIRGGLTFGFTRNDGKPITSVNQADSFTISITGGVDAKLSSLVSITVEGTLTISFSPPNNPTEFDLNISGQLKMSLLGQAVTLVGAAGHLHIDSKGVVWGALAIASNLDFLSKLGLTAEGTAILELNATNSTKSTTLDVPGKGPVTVNMNAGSFNFYVDGALTFTLSGTIWFQISGVFNMEISAEGFTVVAQGQVLIGPDGSFLKFGVTGFLQINASGVAALLDLSLATPFPSSFGVTFEASFLMSLNTTGKEITYKLPQGTTIPGGGQSRTIVVSKAAPGQSAGPYLLVTATGTMKVLTLSIDGTFSMIVSTSSISMSASGNILFKVGSTTLFKLSVNGGFTISSAGVAATFSLGESAKLPSSFGADYSLTFLFEANTTKKAQTIGTATLEAGTYARVRANGSLKLLGLNFKGYFLMTVDASGVQMDTRATFDLALGTVNIFSFEATGGLILDDKGFSAAFALTRTGTLPSDVDFSINATYQLEINTTNRALTLGGIALAAGPYARVKAAGSMTISSFTMDGTFDFSVSTSSLRVEAAATMELKLGNTSFMKFNVGGGLEIVSAGIKASLSLTVNSGISSSLGFGFEATFRFDINTTGVSTTINGNKIEPNTVLLYAGGALKVTNSFSIDGSFTFSIGKKSITIAASASLSLFGVSFAVAGNFSLYSDGIALQLRMGEDGLTTGFFSLTGEFELTIDTRPGARTKAAVSVRNVELTIAGFTLASAELSITVTNGKVTIDIPERPGITLNFFNLASITVFGTISSDGTFSLTGTGRVDLGNRSTAGISGGEISVTISNTGVKGTVNGKLYLFNTAVIDVSGTLSVTSKGFSLSLSLKVDFTIMSFLKVSGTISVTVKDTGVSASISTSGKLWDNMSVTVYGAFDSSKNQYALYCSASIDIGNDSVGASGDVLVSLANYSGTIAKPGTDITFKSGTFIEIDGKVWAGFKVAGTKIGVSASFDASIGTDGEFSAKLKGCVIGICVTVTVHVSLKNGFDVWLSDVEDATVFLDINLNGVLDPGEPFTIADSDGKFNFSDPLSPPEPAEANVEPLGRLTPFDRNNDGILAADEGVFMLSGGSRVENGQPFTGTIPIVVDEVSDSTPYEGATVFFDTNLNGVLDAGEFSVQTDPNGRFSFLGIDASARLGGLAGYDWNRNTKLDAWEGQMVVEGGRFWEVDLGIELPTANYVIPSSMVGLEPASGATAVFWDANFNKQRDANETFVVPNENQFYSFVDFESRRLNNLGRLTPFDSNKNGKIDTSEGLFVITGGTDKNTGLPNQQVITIPATNYGSGLSQAANALTDLQTRLEQDLGATHEQANENIQAAFGFPDAIDVATFHPRDLSETELLTLPAVAGSAAQLGVLGFIAAGALSDPGTLDLTIVSQATLEVAKLIRSMQLPNPLPLGPNGEAIFNAQLDLSQSSVVRTVLTNLAVARKKTLTNPQLEALTQIISSLDARVQETARTTSHDVMTALAGLKALTQTDALNAAKEIMRGAGDPLVVAANYVGINLTNTIASLQLPPFILPIEDQTGAILTLPVSVENPSGLADKIIITINSDNSLLLPERAVTIQGTGNDRLLRIEAAPHVHGEATITLTATLPQDGKAALTYTETFQLIVAAQSAVPQLGEIPDQTITKNGTTGLLRFELTNEEADETLAVTATADNDTLLPAGSILLSGAGKERFLELAPGKNQTGVAHVTLTVSDGTSNSTSIFKVTVSAPNGAPELTVTPNPVYVDPRKPDFLTFIVAEDSVNQILSLRAVDPETEEEFVLLSITSDHPELLAPSSFVFQTTETERTLTLVPLQDRFGIARVSIVLSDGQTSTVKEFDVEVTPTNDAPILEAIPNQTVLENGRVSIPLEVSDAEWDPSNLLITADSSDVGLFQTENLDFVRDSTGRLNLVVQPTKGRFGTATLTVRARDGSLSTSQSFGLQVIPLNSGPIISDIPDQIIYLNDSTAQIPFTISDREEDPSSLTLSVSSDDPLLLPEASFSFDGSSGARSLKVVPLNDAFGIARITVTVSDGKETAATSFVLTVREIEDPNPTPDTSVPLRVESWESLAVHGNMEVGLAMTDDGKFSESRLGGITRVRITFNQEIDSSSLSKTSLVLTGISTNNTALNLSGFSFTWETLPGNKVVVITLSERLSDVARFRFILSGIRSVTGEALESGGERVAANLLGDANGDLRVDNVDLAGVRSLRSTGSIDPSNRLQVRSDLTLSGLIDNSDASALASLRGNSVRSLPEPALSSQTFRVTTAPAPRLTLYSASSFDMSPAMADGRAAGHFQTSLLSVSFLDTFQNGTSSSGQSGFAAEISQDDLASLIAMCSTAETLHD